MLRLDRGKIVRLLLATAIAVVTVGPASAMAGGGKGGGGGGTRCSRRSPCDTTPPTISILNPVTGTSTSGAVTVTGSASDDRTVTGIVVRVDGGAPQSALGTGTWTEPLDTTAYSDGTHTITASATDGAGNVGTATVTVQVSNAPAPIPTPSPSPSPAPTTLVQLPTPDPGTISGFAFVDPNRSASFEVGEQPLAGQFLYLFNAAGAYVTTATTGADGYYRFAGLSDGNYSIELDAPSWWTIRDSLVLDTTDSVLPQVDVHLAGSAVQHFGWRPILRSADVTAPISAYLAPSGLRVQSYDDAVSAHTIYDRLLTGSLIGPEASSVTIRFDFGTGMNVTSTGVQRTDGVYSGFRAVCYLNYESWLDTGDNALFHEYGHAWSQYYAYMVQQDGTFSSYLRARGLSGDPRLGTSYPWDVNEIIAEDYRQLFGTDGARSAMQMNRDIPTAPSVAGLSDFLSTTFRNPPG